MTTMSCDDTLLFSLKICDLKNEPTKWHIREKPGANEGLVHHLPAFHKADLLIIHGFSII